ncbi:MAG: efflux RND transporter permease subunit [Pseudomonadota bacterium]
MRGLNTLAKFPRRQSRNALGSLTWRQPRIVALIVLIIIAAGASALLTIGRQEDPTITNLFALVTTPYPGAEPARVEALVTSEIEDALFQIAEVDVIQSTSSTGISIVQIDLIETVAEERIEQVWTEVRDALADAQASFPQGVGSPDLNTDGTGAFGAIVSLSIGHDGVPLTLVSRWADALADELRGVSGTKLVEVYGQPEEEITVTLDAARTAALGLSPAAIANVIRSSDTKVQAGRLLSAESDLIIEVEGEIESLSRLRSVVVREGEGGVTVRLADIAQIERGARTPAPEQALQNGTPAILVAAKLDENLQVDVWAADIRAKLAQFEAGLPGGIQAGLVFDQSTYTSDRLVEVGGNMAIGVALVVGVLLVTLGLRAALIVAIILPFVTLASLATMQFIGLPIHQMSVTGLIVALGLLVDAGIVMTDEIRRRIAVGSSREDAVAASVSRLTMPLFASTATTALSFTPMILLPGPAGDFVGSIALAVVIMLVWSFLIAVTITPALAGWLLPSGHGGGIRSGFVGKAFRWTLTVSGRNPVRSIAVALILPVLGFASLPLLTAQFFPGVDRDQFFIELDMPTGTAIEDTSGVVSRIDAQLNADERIESVTWTVGTSAPAFYYNITGGRDADSRYAQALVRTSSPEATEAVLPELQRTLPALAPEAQLIIRGLVQGPPVNAPIELRLVGPELDVLRAQGETLRRLVAAQDDVVLARASVTEGAPKIEIEVDEARARLLGFELGMIAAQLEASLVGATGGTLIEGAEELPIRVRLDEARRSDPTAIQDLILIPPRAAQSASTGAYTGVPLSSLADLVIVPGEGQITRRNAERANTIQGFLLRGVLPEDALVDVRAAIEESGFALPDGYRLEIGGDSDARSSTLNNLLAPLGLIVTLSIGIVVMTFKSFRLAAVALTVSGLSAGLSMLALAIFNYPFGINAIIGLIGSIGVSINAALIIMTALQQDPEAATGNLDAMADVVMNSSRHIISTTVTTFGGFLPLILAGGGFWPPFAMAVAGGVLLSTVVSFYFIPPAFLLVWGRFQKSPTDKQSTPEMSLVPIHAKLRAAE